MPYYNNGLWFLEELMAEKCPLGPVRHTHGMEYVDFLDSVDNQCNIMCSPEGKPKYLRLGVCQHRMHLLPDEVEALVQTLETWLDSGTFDSGESLL